MALPRRRMSKPGCRPRSSSFVPTWLGRDGITSLQAKKWSRPEKCPRIKGPEPDGARRTLMRIYKFVNRVPGGMMVVPLFIGMVLNTFFPDLLKIGGFTQALTGVGYPTILGMYLFTVGTKMTLRAAPKMLARGFGIMGAK